MFTNQDPTARITCKGDFTMHALDLNQSMVDSVDSNLFADSMKELDRQIGEHWIFKTDAYADQIRDLVLAARRVHTAGGVTDERTDKQLAARLLQAHGLWDLSEPRNVWDNSKFFAKFAVAYGRLIFSADCVIGRMGSGQPVHG